MTLQTIVAQLTPAGPSALATIAVLGRSARRIVESLFERSRGGGLELGRPVYGCFGSEIRDDVVVSIDDGASESCVEICCHGGRAMMERLVADLVLKGAQLVDWRTLERRRGRSEFQCDALEALSKAVTSKTAAILLDQLNGALDRALEKSESEPLVAREVLKWSSVGRLLERPARVVLFGLANAGKSSLFNALVGYSRVVVHPTAGTTRDVVSETIALDGWPIELVDGAGFRGDASPLEAVGLERLTQVLKTANLRILVADAQDEPSEVFRLVDRFAPNLLVANKVDLIDVGPLFEGWLKSSALSGQGVEELQRAIIHALIPESPPPGAAIPFSDRHRTLFEAVVRRSDASFCLR